MAEQLPIPWIQTPSIQLPPEILMNIMLSTPPKDLQSLCRISKAHAAVCATDYFWKQRLQLDYPQLKTSTDITGKYKKVWSMIYRLKKAYHLNRIVFGKKLKIIFQRV